MVDCGVDYLTDGDYCRIAGVVIDVALAEFEGFGDDFLEYREVVADILELLLY